MICNHKHDGIRLTDIVWLDQPDDLSKLIQVPGKHQIINYIYLNYLNVCKNILTSSVRKCIMLYYSVHVDKNGIEFHTMFCTFHILTSKNPDIILKNTLAIL